jgi:hypothetical protein
MKTMSDASAWFWVAPAAGIVGVVVGSAITQWRTSRREDTRWQREKDSRAEQWEREDKARTEQWEREDDARREQWKSEYESRSEQWDHEDSRRWLSDRRQAYADYLAVLGKWLEALQIADHQRSTEGEPNDECIATIKRIADEHDTYLQRVLLMAPKRLAAEAERVSDLHTQFYYTLLRNGVPTTTTMTS